MIIAIFLILLTAANFILSNYLVNYAIGRSGNGGNRNVSLDTGETSDEIRETIKKNEEEDKVKNSDFLSNHDMKVEQIKSCDNLNLKGHYLENPGSHKWVITIHGYRRNYEDNLIFARNFYEKGFNVLMPDLRACGDSEGKYLGMGWLDRKDVLEWINWILAKDLQAEIVIHGVSMGAATTMMVSGENTPDAVKLFIEDCGYTSVWDIFSNELKLRFNMPNFPILYSVNLLSDIKAEYKFSDASSIDQVSKCQKPMLFIHGTKDDFIPFDMMGKLYNAKPGVNKEQLPVEGAGHAESIYANEDLYWNRVFSFIGNYMDKQ